MPRPTFSLLRPLTGLVLLALSACTTGVDSTHYNGPESLLDVSSEIVNLSVADAASVSNLAQWIERDTPTRAELYCATTEKRCNDARKALELMGVPVNVVGSGDQTATLVYERILARDCDPRYVERRNNHAALRSPSFGCAISANMVQHVSDKQEFVSPALSDNPAAGPAVSAQNRAYVARTPKNPDGYSLEDSLIQKVQSQ